MRVFYLLFIITLTVSSIAQQADRLSILKHLEHIIDTENPRNHMYPEILDEVALYIHDELEKNCDSVAYQPYDVGGYEYRNVIGSIGLDKPNRIIIGAHYDVCGAQDGADDNASAVAGLLELARLLKGNNLEYRLDFVAYTLEEPPYFGTKQMGSYIHAKYVHDQRIRVTGVICMDMIGYYAFERKTQTYPLWGLGLFYGTKGDYITAVKKFGPGKFAKKFAKKFKRNSAIKVKKFTGPQKLPGIGFSDHLNYWKFGYSSLFITNTGFYRNFNYHKKGDSLATLNLPKIAEVVDGLNNALREF